MSNKPNEKIGPLDTDFYKFEGKLATEPIISFMRQVGKNCTGRVIDIGCGKMPYRSYFSKVTRYVGVDRIRPSSMAIETDLATADINELPFSDSEFNVALLNQVIEHVPDPQRLLKEIYRILESKGVLLLTAPQMGRLHGEPWDYYRFTKYGLTYLLETQGFNIEFIEPQGGFWRAIGSHFNFYLITNCGKNKTMKLILRFFIIIPINLFFKLFDRVFYWDLDTLGYNIIARKNKNEDTSDHICRT